MKKFLSRSVYTLLFGLLLLYTACPEGCNIIKYDVTGRWTLTRVLDGESNDMVLDFVGSRSSGEVHFIFGDLVYFVDFYQYQDGTLTFRVKIPDEVGVDFQPYLDIFSGSFEDKNFLSGAFTEYAADGGVGTWTAVRN